MKGQLGWLARGRVSILARNGTLILSHVRDVADDVKPGDAVTFTLVRSGAQRLARRVRRATPPERA